MKKVLVKGPALSRSGYGEQTRFLLKSLRRIESKIDILIMNISWGHSGWITEADENRSWIDQKLQETHKYLTEGGQVDVSIQVTIPNEFEKIAPVNIGYTAGIEVDRVSPEWIQKCNEMDKVIVVSDHSKKVLEKTRYEILKNEQQVANLELSSPVDYVNYCVRCVDPDDEFELNLETDFNFLAVAQIGPRKNVPLLLESFLDEFKDNPNVGLVLKSHFANCSKYDRHYCKKELGVFLEKHGDRKCKVYLLHGDMSEKEMCSLYRHDKISSMVSTTHGEGFGLPLFEAACNGLPVIAPNWSGQRDFLNAPVLEKKRSKSGKTKTSKKIKPLFCEIPFTLEEVGQEAVWDTVINKDSKWCTVKGNDVRGAMRKVYNNLKTYQAKANKLKSHILENFTEELLAKEFCFKLFGESVENPADRVSKEEIPKISLITSVFNAKEHIEQLMEDVTSQTIFKEKCEWVILNANPEGSDEEEKVIQKYVKKFPENIIYQRLEADPGIYATWNLALKMSTGEFITNMNCDDRRAPNALERQAKTLVANPDASLVYNDSYIVHEPNISWDTLPPDSKKYNFEEFSKESMIRGNQPHNNPMWKKDLHEKHGYFREDYGSASDWEFWLRCTFAGERFIKYPEPLGIYYFNPKGISTDPENNNWKRKEEREIFKKYFAIMKEERSKPPEESTGLVL